MTPAAQKQQHHRIGVSSVLLIHLCIECMAITIAFQFYISNYRSLPLLFRFQCNFADEKKWFYHFSLAFTIFRDDLSTDKCLKRNITQSIAAFIDRIPPLLQFYLLNSIQKRNTIFVAFIRKSLHDHYI